MIRITCYTKKNCEVCHTMISIIGNAVAEVNDDCNINIVNIANLPPNKLVELNVEVFPTTIIEKDNKELFLRIILQILFINLKKNESDWN